MSKNRTKKPVAVIIFHQFEGLDTGEIDVFTGPLDTTSIVGGPLECQRLFSHLESEGYEVWFRNYNTKRPQDLPLVTIKYKLSRKGQKEALLKGLSPAKDQVLVERGTPYLVNLAEIDDNGNLAINVCGVFDGPQTKEMLIAAYTARNKQ